MSELVTFPIERSTDGSSVPNQLSVQEIERLIAEINAETIQAIAASLVADVMDRLCIDIRVADTPGCKVEFNQPDVGTGWASAKIYDPDSKLMKILLPTCIDRITRSFSTSSEFVQKGIVFDLLNVDKTGLLDEVEDEVLQNKIFEGMQGSSTFYVILKAKAEEILKFKTEHYMDGKWVASHTASMPSLLAAAAECLI